jgi:hypothetical protein
MYCSFYVYMTLVYGSPLKQGELRRVYIVKRGYIRDPASLLSLSWLPHVLQATSPCGHNNNSLVRDERPSLELIIGKMSKWNWKNIIFTAISQYPQTSTSFKPGGFESTPNLFMYRLYRD